MPDVSTIPTEDLPVYAEPIRKPVQPKLTPFQQRRAITKEYLLLCTILELSALFFTLVFPGAGEWPERLFLAALYVFEILVMVIGVMLLELREIEKISPAEMAWRAQLHKERKR